MKKSIRISVKLMYAPQMYAGHIIRTFIKKDWWSKGWEEYKPQICRKFIEPKNTYI